MQFLGGFRPLGVIRTFSIEEPLESDTQAHCYIPPPPTRSTGVHVCSGVSDMNTRQKKQIKREAAGGYHLVRQ